MRRRLYLLMGELFATSGSGALVAVVTVSFVGPGWNGLLAALAGMLVGSIVTAPVALALTPLFGAFEIMLPAMSAGMVSGTATGMVAAMRPLGLPGAAQLGAAIGLSVLIAVRWLDRHIRRREPSWTS